MNIKLKALVCRPEGVFREGEVVGEDRLPADTQRALVHSGFAEEVDGPAGPGPGPKPAPDPRPLRKGFVPETAVHEVKEVPAPDVPKVPNR